MIGTKVTLINGPIVGMQRRIDALTTEAIVLRPVWRGSHPSMSRYFSPEKPPLTYSWDGTYVSGPIAFKHSRIAPWDVEELKKHMEDR